MAAAPTPTQGMGMEPAVDPSSGLGGRPRQTRAAGGLPARVDARPANALGDALVKRGQKGRWKLVLNEDERQLLAQLVDRDVNDSISAIDDFKRNMVEMQKNWRRTPEKKDFPFEGAYNIMVPLTAPDIEQMKARLLKAIWGDGDLISEITQLDQEIQPDTLKDTNRWYHWELKEIVKLRSQLDRMLHQILVFGVSLPIPSYEHETRMLHSTKRGPLDPSAPIEVQLEGAVQAILGEGSEWSADEHPSVTEDSGDGRYGLSDGGEIVFSVQAESDRAPELVADIWKQETVFDGVKITLTRLQDLAIIPSAETVEDIPFFCTRHWVSVQDYRERLHDGVYIDYGRVENEKIVGMADIKVGDAMTRFEDNQADAEEGVDSSDASAYYPNRRWIEVYRWEGWFVRSHAGREQTQGNLLDDAIQVVAWVAKRPRKLIRVELLEDLNKSGKRSPVKFGFIHEPGRFFPMGLAEWLRWSQAEMDAIHNQRLDSNLLMNVPFFFYKPASGFKKDIIKIKPGEGYPVADPQGINFPQLNWKPNFQFQEEMLSDKYAGRQAGLTDAAMGQQISKRQSASEFVGTASALDLRTERIIEDLLESLRELLYRILGLYQQFGPATRIYRVAGDDGAKLVKKFERDRLSGKLHLELAGNLARTNEQLQRQTAVDMLQLLLNEMLIQLGIVGPDTIFQAITAVAKNMHLDIDLHKPDVPPQSQPPQLENRQLYEGLEVRGPNMTENFNEHLAVHMKLATGGDIKEWPPDAQQRLAEHIKATTEMQQQAQIMRQMMAIQAVSMAGQMAEKGINPGKPGGQRPGEQGGRPATQGEMSGGAQGGPTAAPAKAAGGTPAGVG